MQVSFELFLVRQHELPWITVIKSFATAIPFEFTIFSHCPI